jgi:hypothetical protein
LVKAPWNNAVKAARGSEPVATTAMPATTKPLATEMTGMRMAEKRRR